MMVNEFVRDEIFSLMLYLTATISNFQINGLAGWLMKEGKK